MVDLQKIQKLKDEELKNELLADAEMVQHTLQGTRIVFVEDKTYYFFQTRTQSKATM